MRKTILACVAVALVAGTTTATAASLITSRDIEDGTIKNRDIKEETIRANRLSEGVQRKLEKGGPRGPKGDTGAPGPQGPAGAKGDKGDKGDPGKPAESRVSSLAGQFEATNSSVSLTPDGVEFGPYANGGAAGGSLYYTGLNGKPLSDVKNLAYYARYVSAGDTGGVGVPYLRIFTDGEPDEHSVIFSPNTQPPDADVDEGPFHEWVATSGLWRYDDDAGDGSGEYGVNGAPFSEVIADHGTETISGIYISTGFTAGTDLAALLRWMEINGEKYAFRG